jgi:HSP20 family molecular chaperone IbpA
MFKKKEKCKNCGEGLKKDWNYCPYCGFRVGELDPFSEFEKFFRSQFPLFKLPKMRIRPSKRGISIVIRSVGESQPKIEIKTFGEKPYKKLSIKEKAKDRIKRIIPKKTEEPKARIRRLKGKEIITIELPGVKRKNDIE